ncbi:hypothetical protein AYI70_g1427 [Smittium culicis]|uniref:Uncharacterized protein n=1 Tax=Smittium culicis TaxID=133412 RepID=A0A1R1YCN6_9FUNG|nr:hypothetical protein AYI70_g1427 [Smittium culicis]
MKFLTKSSTGLIPWRNQVHSQRQRQWEWITQYPKSQIDYNPPTQNSIKSYKKLFQPLMKTSNTFFPT